MYFIKVPLDKLYAFPKHFLTHIISIRRETFYFYSNMKLDKDIPFTKNT